MSLTRRASRVATIVTILLAFTAVAAWAHARLVRSDPPKDARLAWQPAMIHLEFSEAVAAATSRVDLVAPDSQRLPLVVRGDSAGNRRILVAEVPPLPSSGSYRVEWRLIGPDGHAMTGNYSFSVDSIVGRQSVSPVDSAPRRTASPPSAIVAPGSPLQRLTRFLWIIALLVVLGSTSLSVAVLPRVLVNGPTPGDFREGISDQLRSWIGIGAWVLLILAFVRLTSQALVLSGSQAIRVSDVTGIIAGSTWGRGWLVFVAATIAVLIFSRASKRTPVRSPWPKIVGACAVLAIASPFLGHPAATAAAPLAMSMDALHVVAAGGWGGTLLMLALVGTPRMIAVERDQRASMVRALLRAFTPVALSCAAVLVVTGSVEAWLQLGSVPALWNSEYGQALVRKLVFVSLVASLGAYHWRFAQPSLSSDRSLTALRWSIALDVMFLLAVLALTAILTGTAPPASVS